MNFKHILVPIDFSESTQPAISRALELAGNSSAKITLFHVLQVLYPPHLQPVFSYERKLKDFEVETEKQLRQLAGSIAPASNVGFAMAGGVPWERIVHYADKHAVDLIVMPTHGRSGLKHLWLGSVAERVVQHAPCDVLIVRTVKTHKEHSPQSAENRCCHSEASGEGARQACTCGLEKGCRESSSGKPLATIC